MEQVSDNCYAVLNEKNLVCDANSRLIKLGGGVVWLGTLRRRFAEPTGKLLPSRWPLRPALQKYHV
jgi:hypothetical protein